jgi:membrane-bound ClpP family serine protease
MGATSKQGLAFLLFLAGFVLIAAGFAVPQAWLAALAGVAVVGWAVAMFISLNRLERSQVEED